LVVKARKDGANVGAWKYHNALYIDWTWNTFSEYPLLISPQILTARELL